MRLGTLLLLCCCAFPLNAQKRLLVCGDDAGAAHSFNDATIEAFDKGIMKCANVIVAGPWFKDIARRLNERPGMAVGLHLALTAEWDGVKWGPLTRAKSLADGDGYFFPNNRMLFDNKPDLGEVERELRAQIEMARKNLKRVDWLWPHMGTVLARPEFRAVTEKLSAEYQIPILGQHPGIKSTRYPRPKPGETAAQAWQAHFESLAPGTYFFIEHPATDTPEARALGINGRNDIAEQRAGVLKTYTDPAVKEALTKAGVELMTPDQARAALQ